VKLDQSEALMEIGIDAAIACALSLAVSSGEQRTSRPRSVIRGIGQLNRTPKGMGSAFRDNLIQRSVL